MKLLELYTSIQGEGPNTGKPIQFVRFAGCNMRCPGWPCDTPQAIFPDQYKDEYEDVSVLDMIKKTADWPKRVCITGGEPFIQPAMPALIKTYLTHKYGVDVFTNGSFEIPFEIATSPYVDIVMDWKLCGSGEAETKLDMRKKNAQRMMGQNIKFVVKDEQDLWEAKTWTEEFPAVGVKSALWVGAAWGHIEDAEIVEFMVKHQMPWRLNVQQHNYIWDPQERYR